MRFADTGPGGYVDPIASPPHAVDDRVAWKPESLCGLYKRLPATSFVLAGGGLGDRRVPTNPSPNFALLDHYDARLIALGTQVEEHFVGDANRERIRLVRRKKKEESELAKMSAKGKPPKDDRWKTKYRDTVPVKASGLPKLPDTWNCISSDTAGDVLLAVGCAATEE